MNGMFSTTFRRVATAGATAVAGAAAVQPSVHARAPVTVTVPQAPEQRRVNLKLEDDWMVLSQGQEELVLFKPYTAQEVDQALEEVSKLVVDNQRAHSPPHVLIEDLSAAAGSTTSSTSGSAASSETTDGADADAVLGADLLPPGHYGAYNIHSSALGMFAGSGNDQMADLFAVTSKLLKRPGLQAEIVTAMMEDPEIRDLMLGQGANLDAYLAAAGIHAPGLLPPAAAATAGISGSSREGEEEDDLLHRIVSAVASAVDQAGSALERLGDWLRDRFAAFWGGEQQHKQQQAEGGDAAPGTAAAAAAAAKGGRGSGGAPGGKRMLLGGVMVVAIAVFCMLLMRKPAVLRRMRL